MALVVLFLIWAMEAQASSYLFRLSEAEIDGVMSYYYPKGYDRESVLRQMSEPFDCRNVGDLCREVGQDYAYQLLETAWKQARMQYSIEAIDRMAQHQLEILSGRWFEQLYPLGVPDKDPYFGDSSSEECSDTVSETVGDFRVVHTSRRHSLIVYAWGRVKVEHFKKNSSGTFKLSKADLLEVEGNVTAQTAGFDPVIFPVFDSKETAKSVAQSHRTGGLSVFAIPFVEGCGGVPNSALQ
ncbi:MAG: hypothetical protein ACXWG4_12875, partial [Thermoanaerobaculia bacterium]